MHVKCVFGHTERVVLVCCERVITFVPEIIIIMEGHIFPVICKQ